MRATVHRANRRGPRPSAALMLTAASLAASDLRAEEAAESRVHALLNVEFANEYVTPRGMLVRDKGVTVQPLLLGFVSLYKGDTFVNSVTFVGGVWNDLGTSQVSIHGPYGSQPKTVWTEIDPIAGFSFGFAKNFTLDVTYTAFAEQILDIGTSHHLETKLSFNDSEYLKEFALHPYVSYWQELDGKATDAALPGGVIGLTPVNKSARHAAPGSSGYFDLGIAPSHQFGAVKLEAPMRVLLPDERFYGDFYAKSSTVGLYELGLKGSVPMKFMPSGFGNWSFHAGFKYLHFVDDNLYNLNLFNAPGKPTRDTVQIFLGVSTFF